MNGSFQIELLNAVTAGAVPEPSSIALVASGILGLVPLRRRQGPRRR